VLEEKREDGPDAGRFRLVDPQLPGSGIDVVAQQRQPARPLTLAAGGGDLVTGPLGNQLPFKLGKRQEHVEDKPADRSRR
jgi:hypothetical protein